MQPIKQVVCLGVVLMMAACTTSQPATVNGVKRAIGQKLPGAQGLTLKDQDRIDDTVARGCAAGIYPVDLCDRHTQASAKRRMPSPDGEV